MNKCMSNLIVVALVLLMPCLAFALPGAHDPASGNGYTCNSCHVFPATYGNTDPTYTTNICFTCHNSAKIKTNKAFLPTDYADIDNTSAAVLGRPAVNSRIQSSHKWFGPDNNATAKAMSPTPTGVNGLTIAGKGYSSSLACVRCHAVHGTSGVESNNAPYLRAVNDADQLCMNCHRPRATTTHITGTHPVNVSYTSASVKSKTGQFVPGAPLANLTNPTAVMKNKNSIVVCSSCHGVHVADSNSATLDNYTSSNNGTLTVSDGTLLRVSKRGADNAVTTTNICTNCHIKTHSGQTQQHTKSANIQCMDCHNAHVDETDPLNSTPNRYLLRRFVNWSGVKGNVSPLGTYRKRLVFTEDASTAKWAVADGTGVCQACHALPNTIGAHTSFATSTKASCIGCHVNAPHTDTQPVGGCTGCHGSPPVSPATMAAGYTGNETTSPHLSHAAGGAGNYSFSCAQCHNGSVGSGVTHDTTPVKSYQNVYVTKVPVSVGGIIAGAAPVYATGTTTCTVTYCHSDGTSTTALGSPKTVVWAGGLNTFTGCANCHAAVPTTNSHSRHLTTFVYSCKTCHSGSMIDNTNTNVDVAGGKHVNAVKEVEFSGVTPAVGATCATVYCHSNGNNVYPTGANSPVWGTASTGICGTCHETALATATRLTTLTSNGHAKHLVVGVVGVNNTTACATCHTGYTETGASHVNGTVAATAGCSVSSCHGTIAAPTWSVNYTGKDSCTKCHGVLTNTGVISLVNNNRYLYAPMTSIASATDKGKVSGNLKKGAHETHLRYLNGFSNYSTVDYRCQGCHGALPATNSHSNSSSVPAWSATNVVTNHGSRTAVSIVYNPATGSCTNTYCHNPVGANGMTTTGSAPVPLWNNASYIDDSGKSVANCGKCHGTPNGSFVNHGTMTTDAGTNCAGCHGHNGDNTGVVGQRHMDGIRYANGACDTCHGYPPMTQAQFDVKGANFADGGVEKYLGGGGHHTTHLLTTVRATEAFTPCLPCHPDTMHKGGGNSVIKSFVNVNIASDTTYRFNQNREKRYKADTTCWNVSCHFQPTPAW